MLGQRVKKLILFRLLFGVSLLYGPSVVRDVGEFPFYLAAVVVASLSVIYLCWFLSGRRYQWLSGIQILGDVCLVTYLVYVSGGTESLFAIFYPLSILSAAMVMGGKRSVVAATTASCMAYLGASIAARITGTDALAGGDTIYFLYGAGVRIAIFFVVGRLSRQLSGTVAELETRLKLSERLSMLGEVISKISHEIRNPLASIHTAAEVLRDSLEGSLNPTQQRMIGIIDQESDRMTKTLQRILNYTKQARPEPKLLDFDALVERVLGLVRLNSTIQSNGITVEKEYETGRTHVYADEEQIVAALLNLAQNAYQAMPQGGMLRVRAVEDLRGTRIDLEDTAGGIPKEKLKDLFVPFRSTKKGGTGIGLAEVQKIVTLHEGRIDVESYPKKGTTFHLFFPKP